MFNNLKEKINPIISDLNLFVDSIYISEEENIKNLNICLDSNEVIDIDKITEASKLINPIVDSMDLIKDEYVLDIHSKEKGVDNNE